MPRKNRKVSISAAEGGGDANQTSAAEGVGDSKPKTKGPDTKVFSESSSSSDESKMTIMQKALKKHKRQTRAAAAREEREQAKRRRSLTKSPLRHIHSTDAERKNIGVGQHIETTNITSAGSGGRMPTQHQEFMFIDGDHRARDNTEHNDLKVPACLEPIMTVCVRNDPKGPRVLVHSNPGEWANLLSQTETLRDGTVKDMPSQLFDCLGFGVSHARPPTRNIAAEGSTSGDHSVASTSPVHLQHAAEDLSGAETMRHIAGSSSGLQLIAAFGCEGLGVDQLFGPPHGLQLLTTFHCTNDITLPVLCKDRVEQRKPLEYCGRIPRADHGCVGAGTSASSHVDTDLAGDSEI